MELDGYSSTPHLTLEELDVGLLLLATEVARESVAALLRHVEKLQHGSLCG